MRKYDRLVFRRTCTLGRAVVKEGSDIDGIEHVVCAAKFAGHVNSPSFCNDFFGFALSEI